MKATLTPDKRVKTLPLIMQSEALLSEDQAGAFLGVVKKTLQKWRLQGDGPRAISLGYRTVRYKLSDLEQWLSKK